MSDRQKVGRNFKKLREARKMSQAEAAKAIGIHERKVRRVEDGESRLYADELERAAELFSCDVRAFYRSPELPPPAPRKSRRRPRGSPAVQRQPCSTYPIWNSPTRQQLFDRAARDGKTFIPPVMSLDVCLVVAARIHDRAHPLSTDGEK